jgi:trk system potassium uptake protein
MERIRAFDRRARRTWISKKLSSRHMSPERMFILSFAGVISAGGFLLGLPVSGARAPVPWVDALFQSASAVCVTGLATIDIGQDLSTAGQVILMFLFQVGGLGILTFSALFFVLMGRGLASKERDIMQSVFLHTPRRDLASILKFVLLTTMIYEGCGTLILWVRFSQDYSWNEALYRGLFHAVSAFNNCGFSLFSNSFMSYQGDLVVNLTMMGLIVSGGLGFIVHYDLHMRIFANQRRLSVHTKIVLTVTLSLLVAGSLLFYFFEHNRVLQDLPLQNRSPRARPASARCTSAHWPTRPS